MEFTAKEKAAKPVWANPVFRLTGEDLVIALDESVISGFALDDSVDALGETVISVFALEESPIALDESVILIVECFFALNMAGKSRGKEENNAATLHLAITRPCLQSESFKNSGKTTARKLEKGR